MNKEKIKTILLISLVLLSVFLTQKLFIDVPLNFNFTFADKEEIENVKYIISDIVTPNRYLINYSRDNHTIIYSSKSYPLWSTSKSIIKDAFNNGKIEFSKISYEEFSNLNYEKSIVIQYSEPIDGKLIARLLEVDKKNLILENSIMPIKEIYINLTMNPFIVFGDGNNYIKSSTLNLKTEVLNKTLNDIKEDKNFTTYYSRKEILGTEKDIYAPHNTKIIPYDIYVTNKLDIKEEAIIEETVQRFFDKDINYVKRVIENKANIYMHENKRMIINENGVLEYYSTISETVSNRDFFKSLKTALDFIMQKDKLPNDIYLISASKSDSNKDKGYKFVFGYRLNEVPLYMKEEIKDYSNNILEGPIEIEVYGDFVKSYKTYIRSVQKYQNIKQTEIKELPGPLNHIANNLPIIMSNYINENGLNYEKINHDELKVEIIKSINDITFGYYDRSDSNIEEKVIPAWIVDIGKTTYVFDYETGRILNRETMR